MAKKSKKRPSTGIIRIRKCKVRPGLATRENMFFIPSLSHAVLDEKKRREYRVRRFFRRLRHAAYSFRKLVLNEK